MSPEILPFGVNGLLVRFSTVLDDNANRAVLTFRDALDESPLEGIVEIATSLTSVLVLFDPQIVARDALSLDLTNFLETRNWYADPGAGPGRVWHIPVNFSAANGPQLSEAAALGNMTEQQAIDDIISHKIRVLAIGFAPGQPYLGMLPKHWDLPRQTALTPRVPAGALVIAIRQLVLFTAPAPTGWRQIGRTLFRPFCPEMPDPFPLLPGDQISFSQVSDHDFHALENQNSNGLGGARLEVTS